MIYANLVNCKVFLSLHTPTRIVGDGDFPKVIGIIGEVQSAGADYLRIDAYDVVLEDESVIESDEPTELTLQASVIALAQLLEEPEDDDDGGLDLDEEEEDDEEEEAPSAVTKTRQRPKLRAVG